MNTYIFNSLVPTTSATTEESKVELIFPSYQSILAQVPETPNYIGGHRSNVASFGTQKLTGFTATDPEIIRHLGADFKAVKTPLLYKSPNGEITELKNANCLINSQSGKPITDYVTNRYEVFDFNEAIAIYFELLNHIKSYGYNVTPAYGKVYNGGARMFLQHLITGGQLMNEPTETYVALMTSHDKSMGLTFVLTTVRLFCQNQVHRALKEAMQKLTLKHTSSNKARLEIAAKQLYEGQKAQAKALEAYCEGLAAIKINTEALYNAYAEVEGLRKLDSQRKINNFSSNAEQLIACYNQENINNFRGTALGAYYAYTDFSQHVVPLRKTDESSYYEEAFNGNPKAARYIDTLVSMVN